MPNILCPKCDSTLAIAEESVGYMVQCSTCHNVFDAVVERPSKRSRADDGSAVILNATCPHCGALLDITPEWLGQQIECGGCSNVFACPEFAEEAPSEDGPKALRETRGRKERNRDRDDDGRWEGYEECSTDDDPDSHLAKKRGPGFATASMVLGIVSITLGTILTVTTCGFGGFIQIIMSLIGIILGYLGIRSDARGNAIAGMVMNVLGALFAVIWMSFLGVCITMNPFRGAGPPPAAATQTVSTWKSNTNPPPAKAKW